MGVQSLFLLYLIYAVFISKPTSREGMGKKLRVSLTVVAVLFALLWGLVAFVNFFNLDRDNVAPEWIQSSFGIYLFTYILIFGFKPPAKSSVKDFTSHLRTMSTEAKSKLSEFKQRPKSNKGINPFKWVKKTKEDNVVTSIN